jgi:predicted membrane protein
MDKKKRSYFDMRLVIGLLIIAAGILLLLKRLDIGSDYNVGDYWPVILIVIGLGKILQPKEYRQLYWGFIIMAVGALFLLNNLGYIRFWFNDLWPILLILLGIEIIRRGFFKHTINLTCCFPDKGKHFHNLHKSWKGISNSNNVDNDYVDISVTLGGGEYRFTNKQLKGGSVSAIMGGCEMDFRHADMEKEEMVLDVSAIMGEVEIRVPSHWEVVMQGSPVLGSVEDKTTKPGNAAKKLIIKGSAVMGGVKVTN